MKWTATDKFLLSGVLPVEAGYRRLRDLLDQSAEPIDWSAISRRADFHQAAPLLRFNLFKSKIITRVPESLRTELEGSAQIWAARHLAYVNEAGRLIAAFRTAGIDSIPLKGAALMLAGYYPQAGLRTAQDLDLLIDPARIEEADSIADKLGYRELPGRRAIRSRQRLANEVNHLWPRRGNSGIILELHHRAFQFAQNERDLTYHEIRSGAFEKTLPDGGIVLLPSPFDLALHLIHHTMVDLQTTHAILRTFADLHFIFSRNPDVKTAMLTMAHEFGFGGVARPAIEALNLLSECDLKALDPQKIPSDQAILLETALCESPLELAETARLLEYFDFKRRPARKLANLLSLVFTSRSHLNQLYGGESGDSAVTSYLRRPFDLMKKFNWKSLRPKNLIRVRRLRRMAGKQKSPKFKV